MTPAVTRRKHCNCGDGWRYKACLTCARRDWPQRPAQVAALLARDQFNAAHTGRFSHHEGPGLPGRPLPGYVDVYGCADEGCGAELVRDVFTNEWVIRLEAAP